MHKSSKADKRALKSNAKRVRKELKAFESAGKNAKALKRGTRHIGQIFTASIGDRLDRGGYELGETGGSRFV
ncbi:hypothetical protein CORC01_01395 [Colletotrichum orchidophilum]|uniref:Uncharacterized protein n=1 Tax=Colletotrichum orchidophilum TaxID=1209926 RepID=A0A1G4BPF2_9PEZI|nr:uncharacterized protein CORC01_01395 [Colletotrichum orchidophilum]OHF03342.1 hypothetical protein CORC01_01395 [Colletotrichum orchidophilum]